MRKRSADTSILEWVTILSLLAAAGLIVIELIGYSQVREQLPPGMRMAGVPVGGMTLEEAAARVQEVYSAPVTVYYGDQAILLNPADISFEVDLQVMMARAETFRAQSNWWAGFWAYLWRQPGQTSDVQLAATYSRSQLRAFLEDVAARYDRPPTGPVGVTGTLEYVAGQPGFTLDVSSSEAVIDAALQVPTNRRAMLTVRNSEAAAPTLETLGQLIRATMDRRAFDGIYSVVVIDLETGEELAINPDVAYAGMSLLKVPLIVETYRMLDTEPIPDTAKVIEETIVLSGNFTANLLLRDVLGNGTDMGSGAVVLTNELWALGLVNTFIAAPYDDPGPYPVIETPANQRKDLNTNPDPAMQTTAGDMATLLMWLYQCAEDGSGGLTMLYSGELTQGECRAIVELLKRNDIDVMLEAGVPPEAQIAHKHGFSLADTHGDAAIVYSPGGDYVVVLFLYLPPFLEWEISAPLYQEISAAVYRYFNP